MDIYHIHPYMVRPVRSCTKADIQRQMDRLRSEGQIEPIVVKPPKMGQYEPDREHPDYWYYSPEMVEAAIRLGWDEILVTY